MVQKVRDITEQLSLKASIKRMNNVRARYRAVPQEGIRVARSITQKGLTLTTAGAERARQLRSLVNRTIQGVENRSSKAVAGKTALVLARSQAGAAGGGKGGNVNTVA